MEKLDPQTYQPYFKGSRVTNDQWLECQTVQIQTISLDEELLDGVAM
jgi:hypothetical protein